MRKQKDITVFTIGNKYDFDSFRKLHKARRLFKEKGLDYKTSTYDNLLKNRIPRFKTENIVIFPFFPFSHWNKHIEPKDYRGIYGARSFYNKFCRFYIRVDSAIQRNLKEKSLFFVNHPLSCSAWRDKLLVKNRLKDAKVPTPKTYKKSDLKKINNRLNKGDAFFIKPRFGSMGKGITYLSKNVCQTNFSYRKGKILSRKSDYGWSFRNIKDRPKFLKQLFKKDVYIEEAVKSKLINNKKFDLRVYVFLGRVVYVYSRINDADRVTTNISQGGKGMTRYFLRNLPKSLINKIEKTAIETAKALRIGLAGVDIVVDKNLKDVYVLDVNLFPGFPKKKTFNLPARMINILNQHLK